ncbi:MAG: ABATE domain-containing protein [Pseudonocardia sp.]|nr:ABATE domain-containing protein [Pseudonocardia sp.]MBO0876766.1 ABATE domain-containing protein [Pseudonocardia sp.]
MAPRKADLSQWLFTAGRLSLDFVGTVGYRPAQHVERLTDREALRRWLLEAGLPSEGSAPTDDDLAEARAVREALYHLIDSRVGDEPTRALRAAAPPGPEEVALLNRVAATPTPARRVSLEPTGAVTLGWGRPDGVRPLLSLIVRDAMDLLGGDQLERVRRCAAEDCRKLFLDSAPRPRRWCSARACGTRQRVAAHRARRAGGTASAFS